MSSRSPLVRALLFLLAFVPVVWGTCPRWVAGETCGAPVAAVDGARGSHEVARCPCCPPSDDDPAAPTDGRRSPTDPGSCPVIQLRFTVAPAPTDVALPVADLVAAVATADLAFAAIAAPRVELAPRDTTGGAPPPRVGTVVLRI
ncbi:MAG: hypothetical protein U1E39_09175 [Planctomycetota bacterium]